MCVKIFARLEKFYQGAQMTRISITKATIQSLNFDKFRDPLIRSFPQAPELKSRGDRPLKMTFEDQINALIYFHLQEHKSARHLVQDLKENIFAKEHIAPEGGISRSSFCEAVNHRGLEQLQFLFEDLYKQAVGCLPKEHAELGDLVSIDGSLINAVLSMHWANYRKGSKKAKAHCGFDINHGIPNKIFLTEGNGAERPFVPKILSKGQTGVMDRGYQSHHDFDLLQAQGKHFVCRIKAKTTRTVIDTHEVNADSYIFYDALVLLGTPNQNQTKMPVRVVGYKIAGVKYYVATDRHDLTAEQIATVYKLRWTIEDFFKWWKEHLKVYHLIARSEYGLMVQILSGLITYLLLAIYCRDEFNEKVSVKRVRQLRTAILNDLIEQNQGATEGLNRDNIVKDQKITSTAQAKT